MLTKQELYDLLPDYYLKPMEDYTYMCIDEGLGVYTVDYLYHFWSGSEQQRHYHPDWIIVDNEAYWFSTTAFYDGAPYDHILKLQWSYEDGTQYFSVDLQIQYIPKEVP